VLVVNDGAVMKKMVIKTLDMCGLPIGKMRQVANGKEGFE
jgi:hypothetical protein